MNGKNIFVCFILTSLFQVTLFAQEVEQPLSSQSSGSSAKLLPDIFLNADFSGVYRNLNQDQFDSLGIPGFGDAGFYSETLNPSKGFNFNYAELGMYSVVDPFFDLFATFHLTVSTFEIEEAYVRTLRLPGNLQLKFGKFLSSFGRLNEVHAHAWDFSDQPLVYHSFWGAENLNEMGTRFTWLMPVSFYLQIGMEALTGNNDVSFGATGFTDPGNNYTVDNGMFPGIYIGYLKSSFDIGDLVVLTGFSGASGTMRIDHDIASAGGSGIYGDSSLLGADFTLKWIINSVKSLTWQSEFIYRYVDGSEYLNNGIKQSYMANQSGLYSQLVFQISKTWKTGIRFDLLQKNQVVAGIFNKRYPENISRYAPMMEYSPSEFSRLRLQYSYDQSGYDGSNRIINQQVALNANFNIGSHRAHSF